MIGWTISRKVVTIFRTPKKASRYNIPSFMVNTQSNYQFVVVAFQKSINIIHSQSLDITINLYEYWTWTQTTRTKNYTYRLMNMIQIENICEFAELSAMKIIG